MTSCLWPFGKSDNRDAVPGKEGPAFDYTKIGDRYFPMVDVAIFQNNFRLFKIRALVDSGATLSVFRPEYADFLRINIKDGRKIRLDALSRTVDGYIHDLRVEIASKKFVLPVAFLTESHTSFNILGREAFFEQFKITFDEVSKVVVLK